jgi:hypothetical protein
VSAPITSQAEPWLELLVQQVRKTRFGSIVVTIHEGRVVQVERTEKVRLDSPRQDAATAWAPDCSPSTCCGATIAADFPSPSTWFTKSTLLISL